MLSFSETLTYTTDPAAFTNIYNAGDQIILNNYTTKKLLLSFIEIDNGWSWLLNLVNIQKASGVSTSDVQIIAVIYKSTAGLLNAANVRNKITADPVLSTAGIDTLPNLKVATDIFDGASYYNKYAVIYGNYIWNDPLFPSTNYGNSAHSYIAINDYICDKWHSGATAAGDPISLNHIIINGVQPFNSADFANTEAYVTRRLINLLADPTIMRTYPKNNTAINTITQIQPLTVVFSKPMNNAVSNQANYIPNGGISVGVPSFSGTNRVEGAVALPIDGSLSGSTAGIVLSPLILDTLNNGLTDDTIEYTVDIDSPEITDASLAGDNSYIDIAFSEGVYSDAIGNPVTAGDLLISFNQNGGTLTNAVIATLEKLGGGSLTGGETTIRVNLTLTGIPSGVETIEMKPLDGAAIYDLAVNPMASGQTTGQLTFNDKKGPSITDADLADDNTYLDITFSEGVYGDIAHSIAVQPDDFAAPVFTQHGGTATNVQISGLTKQDGNALAGGETIIRVHLTVTGNPAGIETVEIKHNSNSIYDIAANLMSDTETTGVITLKDKVLPEIITGSLASDNSYIDIVFSEPVYRNTSHNPLIPGNFEPVFTANGGPGSAPTISSLAKITGGSLTGGETSIRAYLAITDSPSGVETIEIKPKTGSVYDFAGNPMADTETTGIFELNDQSSPLISGYQLANDNSYLYVMFNESVYTDIANGAVVKGDFEQNIFTQNTGTATNAVINTVTKVSDGALAGGETVIKVNLTVTGTPNGDETIEIKPVGANAIYDHNDNPMENTETTGLINLNNRSLPAITGAVLDPGNTFLTINFSQGVYTGTPNQPVKKEDLFLNYAQNGSTATVSIAGLQKTGGGALTGGETAIRVNFTITGKPSGVETVEVKPFGGAAVYNSAGRAMPAAETTGIITLNDKKGPEIINAVLAADNTYIDITCSEGIYTDAAAQNPVTAADFSIAVNSNGGTAAGPITINNLTDSTGNPLTGGETAIRVHFTFSGIPEGVETIEITPVLTAGITDIYDASGNLMDPGETTGLVILNDQTAPKILLASLANDNSYIEIAFNEGVYGDNSHGSALQADDFIPAYYGNGSTVTLADPAFSSITKTNGNALAGGETVIRLYLAVNGLPEGIETIAVKPSAMSIYDYAGNPMDASQTTGNKTFIDQHPPQILAAVLHKDNLYLDMFFSEGVYSDANHASLTAGSLNIAFNAHGGTANNAAISDVQKTSGGTLAGGETEIRVFLSITGIPSGGLETIEIQPNGNNAIYDLAGNPMGQTETTGPKHLNTQKTSHSIALVLDYSGSMSHKVPVRLLANGVAPEDYDPNDTATYTVNNNYNRTQILENAVASFSAVINEFDDNPAVKTRVSLIKYRSNVEDTIDNVTADNINDDLTTNPQGCTALGGGLYRAIKANDGINADHKAIILFTDGMQNQNPMIFKENAPYDVVTESDHLYLKNLISAEASALPWKDQIVGTSNVAAELPGQIQIDDPNQCPYPIFTIGVGSSDLFIAMLNGISILTDDGLSETVQNNGTSFIFTDDQMWPQNNLTFKEFLSGIYDGYSPQVITTFQGFFLAGHEQNHEFSLNKSSKKLVVNINWIGDKPLKIKLIKEGYGEATGINYQIYDTFGIASLNFPNAQFPNHNSKEGIWKIIVEKAQNFNDAASVSYSISVMSDDAAVKNFLMPSLKDKWIVKSIYAGEALSMDVAAIENSSPGNSITSVNAYIYSPVTPVWKIVQKYRNIILNRKNYRKSRDNKNDDTLLIHKWYPILVNNKKIYPQMTAGHYIRKTLKPETRKKDLIIRTKDEKGKLTEIKKTVNNLTVFSGKYLDTKIPGPYRLVYKIKGESKVSGKYERTITRVVNVKVKPDSKQTRLSGYLNAGKRIFNIIITPKDQYGNCLTPGSAYLLTGNINQKTAIRPENILDNFDGSFTVQIPNVTHKELSRTEISIESQKSVIFSGVLSKIKRIPLLILILRFLFYKKAPVQILKQTINDAEILKLRENQGKK